MHRTSVRSDGGTRADAARDISRDIFRDTSRGAELRRRVEASTPATENAPVRYGLTLPIFDALADPALLAELASEAEAAGWDGLFLWDHVYYRRPAHAATDPWIALAAIATSTAQITIGPMVTPLARRRPQIVAREVVALDRLSHGRVVFGVGLGLDASGDEFVRFGEETDVAVRAQMFDEALGLVTALMSGEAVDHRGPHFTATDVRFLPAPFAGRVPIWVAARWPNRRPLRRAAGHNGVFIIDIDVAQLREACAYLAMIRPEGLEGFEVVVQGAPDSDPRPWRDAGATWWLTTFSAFGTDPASVRRVIGAGPPR